MHVRIYIRTQKPFHVWRFFKGNRRMECQIASMAQAQGRHSRAQKNCSSHPLGAPPRTEGKQQGAVLGDKHQHTHASANQPSSPYSTLVHIHTRQYANYFSLLLCWHWKPYLICLWFVCFFVCLSVCFFFFFGGGVNAISSSSCIP